MKKILVILIIIVLVIPFSYPNATQGALRKRSIKTCPDGNTYGYHSGVNGGHWHLAEEHLDMSSGWAAVGDPLPGDPCPNEKNNYTTTTYRGTTVANNNATHNQTTTVTTESTTTTTTTSTTTSVVTTTKEIVQPKLTVAVNGDRKSFKNKTEKLTLLYWDKDIIITSNSPYSIKVYDDTEEIKNVFKYSKDNTYRIDVYIADYLYDTYYLKVTKAGLAYTIAIVVIALVIIIFVPFIIIKLIIKLVRKKRK